MYKLSKTLLLTLSITLVVVLAPKLVHAQSKSVSVVPPKFELFGNAGETLTESIRVNNNSDFPVTFSINVESFTSAGEEGNVVLTEPGSENFTLANWIEPSVKDLTLQPGEEKTVPFQINIPRSAEPGGHYASILFNSQGTPVAGGASVSQRIGSLVLLRVSGNVVEDAKVESFATENSYFKNGPIPLVLRMKNDGNVHIRPRGTVVITNMFGTKVDELPLQGANVIPGAMRVMETTWERENMLGIYTATLVGTYGQEDQLVSAATRFAVASPTAIVIMIFGVVAFVVVMITLIAGRDKVKKIAHAMLND